MTIDDDDRKIIIHFGVSRKKEKKLLQALQENKSAQNALMARVNAAIHGALLDVSEIRKEIARIELSGHNQAGVFFNQFDARITALEELTKGIIR